MIMTKPFNVKGPKYTVQGGKEVGKEDKRKTAHEQHSNHFTSRADNRSNTETVE